MHLNLIGRLSGLAFIIFVIGSYVIIAQTPFAGEWSASTKDADAGKIQFNFRNAGTKRNGFSSGKSFEFNEFEGLSREAARDGRVNFRLVREAGTTDFEGTFSNGKGSGTYKFVPNAGFADAMRSRGFDFAKPNKKGDVNVEERLFQAANFNLTTALADDLRSTTLKDLDIDDLFTAVIFKIDSSFINQMTATGYPNLEMEDLVKARIFKIDPEYVRQIVGYGFSNTKFDDLVKFRIFKITPEYLAELRAHGLTDLTADELVQLKIFNIDAAAISEARSSGQKTPIKELIRKKLKVGEFQKFDDVQ